MDFFTTFLLAIAFNLAKACDSVKPSGNSTVFCKRIFAGTVAAVNVSKSVKEGEVA